MPRICLLYWLFLWISWLKPTEWAMCCWWQPSWSFLLLWVRKNMQTVKAAIGIRPPHGQELTLGAPWGTRALAAAAACLYFFFPRALALLLFFFLPHSSCFAVSGSQLALISYFFCSCVMLALYQICKFVQLSLKH